MVSCENEEKTSRPERVMVGVNKNAAENAILPFVAHHLISAVYQRLNNGLKYDNFLKIYCNME